MANLFAYRATAPDDMMRADDPIGPENDTWIRKVAEDAGLIVGAWGNDGLFKDRASEVLKMLPNMKCLKQNKTGEPAHPLYQPGSATPVVDLGST